MNIESLVTTLETSKRMAELGFKQDSLFYWWKDNFPEWELTSFEATPHSMNFDIECFSAFTAGELGEMLPVMTMSYRGTYQVCGRWCCEYETYLKVYGSTEAEARALMLIHLVENNLIDPKSL